MNYPNNIKKEVIQIKKEIEYGNRGMDLESDLNLTNEYYRKIDKAFIYKKPTPIKIAEVDYKTKGKVIKRAFFENPSTTDYNGLYDGMYIDFEAKETNLKTSFPLSNIHPHQIEHIRNINNHKGICFLIVRFNKLEETYLLFSNDFLNYIDQEERKSIPIDYFKKKGYLIPLKYQPRTDFLEIIDKYREVSYGK